MQKLVGCMLLLVFQVAVSLMVPGAWAGPAGGQLSLHAIGSSRIPRGDMAAGREEAVRAGLVSAVSRALAEAVPIASVVGNFQVLNETVLNRTDQFVRDYKVLTEAVTGDNYRIILQATVSVDRLKAAAAAAGVRLGTVSYPRTLLCMAEKDLTDLSPRYWWGGLPGSGGTIAPGIVSDIFSKIGFTILQPESAGDPSLNYPPDLGAAEAMDLGRRFDADVVVAGSARVEPATGANGTPSCRGVVHATAYRTVDGQPLAQVDQAVILPAGETDAEGGEALRRAAASAGEALSAKVADAWFKQAALGAGVEIRVHGIGGNIAGLVKFRRAVSLLPGLDNLNLREMTADTAVMTATYQGSARAMADAVMAQRFDTFKVNLVQLEADGIDLELVPSH